MVNAKWGRAAKIELKQLCSLSATLCLRNPAMNFDPVIFRTHIDDGGPLGRQEPKLKIGVAVAAAEAPVTGLPTGVLQNEVRLRNLLPVGRTHLSKPRVKSFRAQTIRV